MDRRFPLVITALMLLAAACGSGGAKTAPTSTPRSEPTATPSVPAVDEQAFRTAAARAARDGNLTLNDLAGLWRVDPNVTTDDDDYDDSGDYTPDCAILGEDGLRDAVTAAESQQFTRSDKSWTASEASVFFRAEAGEAAVATLSEAFVRCIEQERASWQRYLSDGLDPSVTVTTTAALLPPLNIGDQSLGVRFVATYTDGYTTETLTTDLLFVRTGRLAGTMFYATELAPDDRLRDEIARNMARRLRAADAGLPPLAEAGAAAAP